MTNLKEKLKKMIIENADSIEDLGVRSDNNNLEIGQELEVSYLWDYERDCSTYETEEPIALPGTCATEVKLNGWIDAEDEDEVEEIVENIIKAYEFNKKVYSHLGNQYLIKGIKTDGDSLSNDEGEAILKEATVLFKF